MLFNVAQLLKEGVGGQRRYSVDEDIEPIEDTATTHVRGSVRLLRTERSVWVTGHLTTDATATCSRCLEEYRYTVEFYLDDEWFPTIDVTTGVRLPIPDEDALTIDERHILDLREAVRQYTIMNIPMKPLCREDCPGLCPQCGANRKSEPCECLVDRRDPRWGPLLDLLVKGRG